MDSVRTRRAFHYRTDDFLRLQVVAPGADELRRVVSTLNRSPPRGGRGRTSVTLGATVPPENPMSEAEERRYHPFTRLIHGRMHSAHWQYDDHIVPPISSSAAYRLESAQRGAEGFVEFANPEFNVDQHAPIYIYDRLDEPARGMLEENLAQAEGGDKCACFATGMAAISGALGIVTDS